MINSKQSYTIRKLIFLVEQEIFKDFVELFPAEGQVVPYVELKFRLSPKYGAEKLDTILKEFEDQGVLSRFEFNNTVHYKSKKEIPVAGSNTTSASISPPAARSKPDKIDLLSKLVIALAEKSDDPDVKDLLTKYKKNF